MKYIRYRTRTPPSKTRATGANEGRTKPQAVRTWFNAHKPGIRLTLLRWWVVALALSSVALLSYVLSAYQVRTRLAALTLGKEQITLWQLKRFSDILARYKNPPKKENQSAVTDYVEDREPTFQGFPEAEQNFRD